MHEITPLTWNLLLLLVVILFGPFAAERLRLPGIIGLLLGGFLIGSSGLGLLQGETEVEALGHIGLLYLMFVAGLELDLNVFNRIRNAAITFGLLTFALPMLAGTVISRWLGFDWPAAMLIGSLWASHTLVMYPIVQRFGVTSDPAVATTVGATVITDTLALLVLAIDAGYADPNRSSGGAGIAGLFVGLGVLVVYCALVLTRVTRWFFGGLGQDRTLRFVFVVAAFLSASAMAEVGGIEGIVGAFFAGLALNKLVPNGGPLMERVEFFGSALFIPAFLVSVGLLIEPSVLADPKTWELALWFTVALVVGKLSAALAIGWLRGFSRPQIGITFALSLSQAAATLAAVTVGQAVGLLDESVVNAVVVVIVVSLFASSLLAGRAAARLSPPSREGRPLGASIVVSLDDRVMAARIAPLAARLARADGGNVVPAHVLEDGVEGRTLEAAKAEAIAIDEAVRHAGIDAESSLRVAGSLRQGVRNDISEHDASLLIVGRQGAIRPQDVLFGGVSEDICAASPVPVLLAEMDEAPLRRVLVPIRNHDLAPSRLAEARLALDIAAKLERTGLELVLAIEDPTAPSGLITVPADAALTSLGRGRSAFVAEAARAGDLVLLPGGGQTLVFGLDAARIGSTPGVSVAVVVGPYHGSGFNSGGRDSGPALVVGRTVA